MDIFILNRKKSIARSRLQDRNELRKLKIISFHQKKVRKYT